MCGIAGIARFSPTQQTELLKSMTQALSHRGPDDDGFFEAPDQGIALGMTRLAILDIAGVTLFSAFLFWSMVVAPGLSPTRRRPESSRS